ncbi:histone-like nucleoid-structuring protein Lsr2 [Schumannella soli]|uniref:Lsr2 family protein n=1 Tax=Schumannella soli TaxID=2590779 RepID=A0A506Y615_9MICO|nr:Lsr2 family protein [Schumannella soli]TPW77303.1 Lsr2 family protein [Schumannella soli]
MARRTVIQFTDDLSGEDLPDGTRSTTFAFNGVQYSIDLSDENVAKLEAALQPFIDAGTRVGAPSGLRRSGARATGSGGSGSSGSGRSPEDLAAIREWANANGYSVGDRGRVKGEILEAYDKAH